MSEAPDTKRVLFVGQQPETVDFSDSALPPGLDAEKIRRGAELQVDAEFYRTSTPAPASRRS